MLDVAVRQLRRSFVDAMTDQAKPLPATEATAWLHHHLRNVAIVH